MIANFGIIILIIAFLFIRFIIFYVKEKKKERKRLELAKRKRLDKQKEMKRLGLNEKEYNLYKLNQINQNYLLDESLKVSIPYSMAMHKWPIVTYDTANKYGIWDNSDSKLILLLFNCSKIVTFDNINYNEIICKYSTGQFQDLLNKDFQKILIENLEKKTVTITDLLKENNIAEPQTVRGLVSVNFDKATIDEIERNSSSIYYIKKDIERIYDWAYAKSDGSTRTVDWANKKENKLNETIGFHYKAQEAKGIYYLDEFIKKNGKICIIVEIDKDRKVITREVQL